MRRLWEQRYVKIKKKININVESRRKFVTVLRRQGKRQREEKRRGERT